MVIGSQPTGFDSHPNRSTAVTRARAQPRRSLRSQPKGHTARCLLAHPPASASPLRCRAVAAAVDRNLSTNTHMTTEQTLILILAVADVVVATVRTGVASFMMEAWSPRGRGCGGLDLLHYRRAHMRVQRCL